MINLEQTLQYIAFLLALTELIVGLYVLVLNIQHTSNRHTGALMLLISANSFAIGAFITARSAAQAEPSALMLAATTPAIQPLLLLTTVSLLRPAWLKTSRLRWVLRLAYLLFVLPFAFTFVDAWFGVGLWYSGINPATYPGGLLMLESFTNGSLSDSLRLATFGIASSITILLCLYIAAFDKKSSRTTRGLAWLLLASDVFAGISLVALARIIPQSIAELGTSAIFVLVYTIATFRQMISERRVQRGSLRVRLLALNMVVVVPVLAGLTYFVTSQSRQLLEDDANQKLQQSSYSLAASTSLWLESNTRALTALANLPEIRSMDPARHFPTLKALAAAYPEMYLVSTTDMSGLNVARSDGQNLVNVRDQVWFQRATQGIPLTLQTLIGRNTGRPALVASTPIRGDKGQIVGVAMFATDLSSISRHVEAASIGLLGYSYVVDATNQVIAHPEEAFTAVLRDLSQHPAVQAVRSSIDEPVTFGSPDGIKWRAYGQELPNGWAVIVQAPENELQASLSVFQRTAWTGLVVAAGLLLVLASLSVRQSFEPLGALTRAAEAIGAGDLNAQAPVITDDEVGALARTLNKTTSQLGELVSNLENRVTERTRDLEQRAIQLQVTADVAREAAGIRELDELLNHAVQQISDRFGFYHAGIFLVDKAQEYAVLQAASSEGGQRMLKRGHKLKIGQGGAGAVGIVGFAAGSGTARIALDVGADAVFFNNPDLPQTRSEMALPLKVGAGGSGSMHVIGALDVQSTQPSAFREEDIAILQTLADQLALAINNARVMDESRRALEELENLYRKDVSQSWSERVHSSGRQGEHPLRLRYDRMGVHTGDHALAGDGNGSGGANNGNNGSNPAPEAPSDDAHTLRVPLKLRGAQIGSLVLRREPEQPVWNEKETAIVHSAARQIALALENARLLETTVMTAAREHQVADITNKMLSANGIDAVLRTAIAELARYLPVTEGMIHMERANDHEQ